MSSTVFKDLPTGQVGYENEEGGLMQADKTIVPFEGQLTLLQGDGFIRIEPEIPPILKKKLRYYHRALKKDPHNPWKRTMSGEYRNLYETDFYIDDDQKITNYLITMPGFMHRIKNILHEYGIPYVIRDIRTPPPPIDYYKAMQGLREYQYDPALDMLMAGGGICGCPTGFGKTHLIAALFNGISPEELNARNTPLSVLAATDKDVSQKNYNDLQRILPGRDIGLVMSGHKKWSSDIQVITLDSLHKLDPNDIGILVVDEVHTAGTEKRSERISAVRKALKWGVSATPLGRFDGGDLKTEGMFGPVVTTRTYTQGVEVGALVPIEVYYLNCPEPDCGLAYFQKLSTKHSQLGRGIEKNKHLVALLKELSDRIPQDMQTLMIMQHLSQMNELQGAIKGYAQVHAEQSDDNLVQKQLFNLKPVKSSERNKMYKRVESGELKRTMSTYVYKQGVNFPQLEVVICPGGGGSKLVAGQIPGRTSRRIVGKDKSYIIDFWHPWDQTITDKPGGVSQNKPGALLRDDKARDKVYRELGFVRTWVQSLDAIPFLNPGENHGAAQD